MDLLLSSLCLLSFFLIERFTGFSQGKNQIYIPSLLNIMELKSSQPIYMKGTSG